VKKTGKCTWILLFIVEYLQLRRGDCAATARRFCVHELQSSSQLTRWSCDNIGGYFDSSDVHNLTTTTDTTALTTTTPGVCYYNTFHCPGYQLLVITL